MPSSRYSLQQESVDAQGFVDFRGSIKLLKLHLKFGMVWQVMKGVDYGKIARPLLLGEKATSLRNFLNNQRIVVQY